MWPSGDEKLWSWLLSSAPGPCLLAPRLSRRCRAFPMDVRPIHLVTVLILPFPIPSTLPSIDYEATLVPYPCKGFGSRFPYLVSSLEISESHSTSSSWPVASLDLSSHALVLSSILQTGSFALKTKSENKYISQTTTCCSPFLLRFLHKAFTIALSTLAISYTQTSGSVHPHPDCYILWKATWDFAKKTNLSMSLY